MKKRLLYFIGLVGLVMLLAACGKSEVQPVAIASTDTCEVCNMAVLDDQHATQIVLENGRSIVFDDIGCMFKWLHANEGQQLKAKFVRDYQDKGWILVEDATYVYNQSVKTPMAYNVVSFKDQASAEKFAADHVGSTLITANDIAAHGWEQNHEMMKKHGQQNQSHSEPAEMNHSK